MKFALMSDMHFEFGQSEFVNALPEADYLLLAGDMKAARRSVRYDAFMIKAREQYGAANVLEIDGNHTGYGGTISDFKNTQFSIVADDVMIIGATLWSGLGSEFAYRCLNDSLIPGFSWDWMYTRHTKDLAFIVNELNAAKALGLKSVVMTHHLPHWDCVHAMYRSQGDGGLNLGFYTDLDWVMEECNPNVWVCGHTHTSIDIKVHDTRILCNPRGYPYGIGKFENDTFDPTLTFEL